MLDALPPPKVKPREFLYCMCSHENRCWNWVDASLLLCRYCIRHCGKRVNPLWKLNATPAMVKGGHVW